MPALEMSWIVQPDKKYCPYLPPMPIPKPIQGSGVDLYPSICLGTACAIHSACQGEASTSSIRLQLLPTIAGLLRAAAKMPLLGAELKYLLQAKADAVDALIRPVADGAPTA